MDSTIKKKSQLSFCFNVALDIFEGSSAAFCWGGSSKFLNAVTEDICSVATDDACSVASEVISEHFGCRKVSFAPEIVSDVKVHPRVKLEEKENLFYTDREIHSFRQEAKAERRERLIKLRSAPALLCDC
jgi:hypothetical protein